MGYAVQEAKRKLKGGDIRLTSEVYYKEKSLEGRSRADIEETVLSQAQIIVDELGLHNEVELIGARVYGSRSREGLYRPDSDVWPLVIRDQSAKGKERTDHGKKKEQEVF